MKSINNLILYRDFEDDRLLFHMAWIIEHYRDEDKDSSDIEALFYNCLNGLI